MSAVSTAQPIANSHVSLALRDLRDHALVTLLVADDQRKGRIYGITEHGTTVWQTIETHDLR